jgi:dihydrofolate reductase
MRKIILYINSTFNGVVTGDPKEDKTNFMVWTTEASIRSGSEYLLRVMETVDTVLLGRATYEDLGRMSKWPGVKSWPGVNDLALRLGEKINGAHKFVVTRNDGLALKWGEYEAPTQLPGDSLETRIRELKNSNGGDIIIFGSPTLVRSLTDADLIDVFKIAVRPVVVNVGEHLFDGLNARKDFRLVDVHAFEDGSFVVTYEPADVASTAR